MKLHLGFLATLALFSSHFILPTAWAVPVELGEAPGSTLALTLKAIRGARTDLRINIYELSSPEIAQAITEQVQAGVHVDLLMEGQPVGGMSRAEKAVQTQIAQAMRAANALKTGAKARNHLYVMTGKASVQSLQQTQDTDSAKRRYRFDHGKYALVDCARLLIGSENYSPTGMPKAGATGNRGWATLVYDAALGETFNDVFVRDTDLGYGDIQELALDDDAKMKTSHARACRPNRAGRSRVPAQLESGAAAPDTSGPRVMDAVSVTPIFSPDTSLSGLTALLRSARATIDLEQMNLDSGWKGGTSPLVNELIDAARRGVRVRALLNDDAVFDHGGASKNRKTANLLNEIGRSENLPLEARVANLKAMGVTYIHNKGLLVDGDKTLISSINWVWNSVMNNRETAVVLEGSEVNDHYGALFVADWNHSAADSR